MNTSITRTESPKTALILIEKEEYDKQQREILLLICENKALDDAINKLERENLGLRQQVENLKRKEEVRYRSMCGRNE